MKKQEFQPSGILMYFSVAMLLALVATGSGSGAINVSLNIRTSDIMSYLVINARPDLFAGSLHGQMADTVTNNIPFNWLLGKYVSGEQAPEYAHVAVYFLNVLFHSFFLMLIGRAVTGRVIGGYVLFGMLIFEVETTLLPYRVISSSIAQTFAFAALVAVFHGRFRLATAIVGVTVCIHPTFGLFLAIPVFASYVAVNILIERRRLAYTLAEMMKLSILFLLLSSPFFFMSALEITTRLGPSVTNQELWWSFVPSINNLAFPVMRSLPNLIGQIAVNILAIVLVHTAAPRDRRSVIIAVTLGVCVVAYMTQAVFTSAFHSQLVAQLALNHRANAIGVPLIFVAVLLVMNSRVRELDLAWIGWFCLIMVWLFYDGIRVSKGADPAPRILALGNADSTNADTIIALVIALLVSWTKDVRRKHLVAIGTLSAVAFFGWAYNLGAWFLYAIPVLCWYGLQNGYGVGPNGVVRLLNTSGVSISWTVIASLGRTLAWVELREGELARIIAQRVGCCLSRIGRYGSEGLPNLYSGPRFPLNALLTAITVAIAVVLTTQLPFGDAYRSWGRLVSGELRKSGVRHFLDLHVPNHDHVIIMPLRGEGVWLTPVPWRRAYLDSLEGHYLLYQPAFLEDYLTLLKPYAGGGEQPSDWYMDSRHLLQHVVGIRAGVNEVLRLDPKVRWILTYDKYLCGNDVVHAVYDGYGSGPPGHLGKVVLIKTDEFDSGCSYQER